MENTSSTTNTPTAPPRLYRSPTDKVVAGVCGGLASYFRIDPAIVRAAFVVFALAGGASVLLYIVLWIAVPLGESGALAPVRAPSGEMTGMLLVGVGLIWLLANFGLFRLVNWGVVWPLVLVGLGIALLVRRT